MTEQENLFEGQGSEDSAPVDKPDDRFHEFWAAYPHKQGKLQAEAAYLRMTGAGRKIDIGGKKMKVKRTHEQLMAALDKYKASKPSDRPWLNGSTFLNQRFVDFEDMAEESMHQKLARTGPRQPVTEFDKASAAGRWAHEIMAGEDGKRACRDGYARELFCWAYSHPGKHPKAGDHEYCRAAEARFQERVAQLGKGAIVVNDEVIDGQMALKVANLGSDAMLVRNRQLIAEYGDNGEE